MFKRIVSRIQFRLTVAFILITFIPLLATGIYSAQTASDALRRQALQAESNRVANLAANIQDFLRGASDDATFLAKSATLTQLLEAISAGDPTAFAEARRQLADEFIALARTRRTYFKIRYIDATGQEVVEVAADGNVFHVSDGEELQNESKDEYFVNGMSLEEGQVYATHLRLETQGGVIVTPHIPGIRYAAPVFYNGERRGIIVTNLDARGFLNLLETAAEGEEEQLFLVDAEGFYLWHPDETRRWGGPADLDTGERLQRDFPDLAPNLLSGQAGAVLVGDQMIAFAPVDSTAQQADRWTVIEVEPTEQVLASVGEFRKVFLVLTALATILAIGLGAYLARAITWPIVELSRVAGQVSQGDLTPQIPVNSSDEVGNLSRAFGQMTRHLRDLIEQIAVASNRMATEAEELSAMTEEINASAGQVSAAVQQVAQGAAAQAIQAEQSSRAIESLAMATDQIAENAQQVEQASEQAWGMVNRLAEMMETLQRRSEDISNMARTVKRFADQTNLLALNAAIEAARAGEHGKSFAVVADEVRRLAESSRQTVEEITALNGQVQAELQQVLAGMQDIVAAVNRAAALAHQNADATARQRKESTTVVQAVNEMASVTEEQAAGAEEMAAAVEQQMVSTGQLAAATQELSSMATELHELVARFRLSPEAQPMKTVSIDDVATPNGRPQTVKI